MMRPACVFAALLSVACTSTAIVDLPQEREEVSTDRLVDSRDEVLALRVHGRRLEGDRLEVRVERLARPADVVERTYRPVRVEKRSVASWGPEVHLPVWTLGLAVLAPAWVYPAFHGELEAAAADGLERDPGLYHADSFDPVVEVALEKTRLAKRREVAEVASEPAAGPVAGAVVEATWAYHAATSVTGRTGADGRVVIDLGPRPERAGADTPIHVSARVGSSEVVAHVLSEGPLEDEADDAAPRARSWDPFLAYVEDGRIRFDRDVLDLAAHLGALRPRLDTARQILAGWDRWAVRAESELARTDDTLRALWRDRLAAFRAAVDVARRALDRRDTESVFSAAQEAIRAIPAPSRE